MPVKKRNVGGRPRELERPYRLNLYVESSLVSDLGRLARFQSEKKGEPVSLAEALQDAVNTSRLVRGITALGGHRTRPGALSAAIRRGAELHRQGRAKAYFEREPGTRVVVGSTSLGAAWAATGKNPDLLTTHGLYDAFPDLGAPRATACPVQKTCGTGRTLEAHIIHLEDRHGWKRGQVARWLEAQGL